MLQPTALSQTFDKTHNTDLESALELEMLAPLLLTLAIAAPALRCVAGLRERNRNTQFAAAAVGGIVLVAIHSTVDLGIQIPAVAVAYSAIFGVGWRNRRAAESSRLGEASP